MRFITYLISALALFSLFTECTDDKADEEIRDKLGKYVYLDDNDIYHADPYCHRLRHGEDENGHVLYAKHPVDTTDFTGSGREDFRVCARCVDDEVYARLKTFAYRRWIYDLLIQANYEMEPYGEFIKNIRKPAFCETLYQACLAEGWDVGTSEEFSKNIGLNTDPSYKPQTNEE